MRLYVTASSGIDTGLRIGDTIAAVQQALEPIKAQLYVSDDPNSVPHQGIIKDANGDAFGYWTLDLM